MNRAQTFVPVLHGASASWPDEDDTLVAAQSVKDALERLGYRSEIVPLGLDLRVIADLAERSPSLVFNLVEALNGDGTLAHVAPSILDHFGLTYTGGSAQSLRDTLSKTSAKNRLRRARLPTPQWSNGIVGLDACERVIIKSVGEHASIGMDEHSVVPVGQALAEIAEREYRFGGHFFAEAYIEGREFNVSLIEDRNGPTVLPIAEIQFIDFPDDRPKIVDYAAKWDESGAAYANTPRRFDFPARDDILLDHLRALSIAAWKAFELNGYARVDFRVDDAGRAWILEINVNPCISPDAGFAAAADKAGMDYDTLIDRIVSNTLVSRQKAA